MENFVVSARKYRPVRFEEVIGQGNVTTTLKNAIKSNQLAHAYLFCGPRGVGKTTCARILAREVNEFDIDASGETSTSLNIYELDAASNNSVDDIRSLVDQVRIPPQYGKYKVYIIDEVHMLSQQAFNAFLKTLEEPPPYAIFILATTEKQKILPTILSRCQIFDFNRITIDDIVNHLKEICAKENIEADENALHIIAQKADGALRDALSLFDRLVNYSENKLSYDSVLNNLNILDYDYYFKVTDHILSQDHTSVLLVFNEIVRNGFEGNDFISGLTEHFRNLMVCKDTRTTDLLEVTGNLKERYINQSANCSSSFLLNALNLVNQCDINYRASNNKRFLVELTLMKMCHLSSVFSYKDKKKKNDDTESKKKSSPKLKQPESSIPQKPEEQKTITEKVNTEKKAQLETPAEPVSEPTQKAEEPEDNNYPISLKKDLNLGELTGTVSLSELENIDKTTQEAPPQPEASDDLEGNTIIEIDEALLKKAWETYREKLKAENRMSLHHFMTYVEPSVEGSEIILILENKLQAELFNNERDKLLSYFEETMNVKGLSLVTKIDKANAPEVVKKPFTSREKFKKMAEENPTILTLKEKFDLKLDH